MENQDPFYIGYHPKATDPYAKNVKIFIGLAAVIIIAAASLTVFSQRGYKTSIFELGKATQIQGTLVMEPFPMLKIPQGVNAQGQNIYNSVLLIDFGKFGAAPAIKKMEEKIGAPLDGKEIVLEGTLIYYDGKTAIELTKSARAFVELIGPGKWQPQKRTVGELSLQGEIADPKCYFGVMKPGEGKPHKSCAVRCISGGIPPVFKSTNQLGHTRYLLVVGPQGQPINKEVLPFVGEALELQGTIEQVDDWYFIKTNPATQIDPIHPELLGYQPNCKANNQALISQR